MSYFNIIFQEDWLKKGDVITSSNTKPLVVIDVPKRRYYKWYWRLINKLTFKTWFNPSISYTVSDIKDLT